MLALRAAHLGWWPEGMVPSLMVVSRKRLTDVHVGKPTRRTHGIRLLYRRFADPRGCVGAPAPASYWARVPKRETPDQMLQLLYRELLRDAVISVC